MIEIVLAIKTIFSMILLIFLYMAVLIKIQQIDYVIKGIYLFIVCEIYLEIRGKQVRLTSCHSYTREHDVPCAAQ